MWVKKKKKQGPGNKTPTDLEPSAEEAKEVSVTEYFKQMYGRDLQFAHLPAFMSGRDFAVATPLEVIASFHVLQVSFV